MIAETAIFLSKYPCLLLRYGREWFSSIIDCILRVVDILLGVQCCIRVYLLLTAKCLLKCCVQLKQLRAIWFRSLIIMQPYRLVIAWNTLPTFRHNILAQTMTWKYLIYFWNVYLCRWTLNIDIFVYITFFLVRFILYLRSNQWRKIKGINKIDTT